MSANDEAIHSLESGVQLFAAAHDGVPIGALRIVVTVFEHGPGGEREVLAVPFTFQKGAPQSEGGAMIPWRLGVSGMLVGDRRHPVGHTFQHGNAVYQVQDGYSPEGLRQAVVIMSSGR
jgi:hypothetical protein